MILTKVIASFTEAGERHEAMKGVRLFRMMGVHTNEPDEDARRELQ